jgi:hypothetical protein
VVEPAPRRFFAVLRRALVRALKAFVVLLLVVIPVPVASLFARGEKGEKRNLPGQVVRKEDDDGS